MAAGLATGAQGRKEAGTGDADPELESVVALWALGAAPGGDSGDTGRDRARPVRAAGGVGSAGGEPGRPARRAAGHALVLDSGLEGAQWADPRQRDPQPLADSRTGPGRAARRRPG